MDLIILLKEINRNSTILLENIEELVKANNDKNYHTLGEKFGKMIKIILNFYVE